MLILVETFDNLWTQQDTEIYGFLNIVSEHKDLFMLQSKIQTLRLAPLLLMMSMDTSTGMKTMTYIVAYSTAPSQKSYLTTVSYVCVSIL